MGAELETAVEVGVDAGLDADMEAVVADLTMLRVSLDALSVIAQWVMMQVL